MPLVLLPPLRRNPGQHPGSGKRLQRINEYLRQPDPANVNKKTVCRRHPVKAGMRTKTGNQTNLAPAPVGHLDNPCSTNLDQPGKSRRRAGKQPVVFNRYCHLVISHQNGPVDADKLQRQPRFASPRRAQNQNAPCAKTNAAAVHQGAHADFACGRSLLLTAGILTVNTAPEPPDRLPAVMVPL